MPIWTCKTETIDPQTIRYAPAQDGSPIPFRLALELFHSDESFRNFFIKLLADAPFIGYCWETPPITSPAATRPFEFILLDMPEIDRLPDSFSFAEHFRNAKSPHAVVFENQSKDATLIAPTPLDPHAGYSHLAAFIRTAPTEQVHALFQFAGKTALAKLSSKPFWLSTAGMGVAWLHIRIDNVPKYYGFAGYRLA